jgi:hypothetical protein
LSSRCMCYSHSSASSAKINISRTRALDSRKQTWDSFDLLGNVDVCSFLIKLARHLPCIT